MLTLALLLISACQAVNPALVECSPGTATRCDQFEGYICDVDAGHCSISRSSETENSVSPYQGDWLLAAVPSNQWVDCLNGMAYYVNQTLSLSIDDEEVAAGHSTISVGDTQIEILYSGSLEGPRLQLISDEYIYDTYSHKETIDVMFNGPESLSGEHVDIMTELLNQTMCSTTWSVTGIRVGG
jgi:hypothetical protein